jgi:two-component system chemotaxis response regulator CheB
MGASAGGIQVLQRITAGLPRDLPAAVFVVVHIPAWRKSELPAILSRSGPLPAIHPQPQGEKIESGTIYVAPPDHHLVIKDGEVCLWRGPKENRHRPAIDPLFRSAAEAYGKRAIGLIVSGSLYDGAAGLWWVKRYGGIAVVQNPEEADFPQMPCSAIDRVDVDYVAGTSEIPKLLTRLTNGAGPPELPGEAIPN